jgi:adenylate kinase family enzyme
VIDLAKRCHPATGALYTRDLRGYVSDEAPGIALRVGLDTLCGIVVLENLPWTAVHLADLHQVAGSAMVLLHLEAADELVIRRRTQRRYCTRCSPLNTTSQYGIDCDNCGGRLTTRPDDEDTAFAVRLRDHRARTAEILDLALGLNVWLIRLAARAPAAEVGVGDGGVGAVAAHEGGGLFGDGRRQRSARVAVYAETIDALRRAVSNSDDLGGRPNGGRGNQRILHIPDQRTVPDANTPGAVAGSWMPGESRQHANRL